MSSIAEGVLLANEVAAGTTLLTSLAHVSRTRFTGMK